MKLISGFSAFVFATRVVQFLYFLNKNCPVYSHLLCLYSLVCVGPVRKPHCWFSHDYILYTHGFHMTIFCIHKLQKAKYLLKKQEITKPGRCMQLAPVNLAYRKALATGISLLTNEPRHENTKFFLCKNKGADQPCSNDTADQHL